MHKVSILMSTYNGEKYIKQQIESIQHQSIKSISLLVRDDGSNDGTQKILQTYQKYGMLSWYQGRNIGAGQSFLELTRKAEAAEYYAFADQDDYWNKEKIEKAIQKIEQYKDIPCMYCSNLNIVDKNLLSYPTQYDNSDVYMGLESSMLYNVATGCTIVFNNKLQEILQKYHPQNIIYHDWWVYLLALTFGKVIYDKNSYIRYRQHESNVVGFKSSKRNLKWVINKLMGCDNAVRWNKGSSYITELYQGYSASLNKQQQEFLYNIIHFKESYKVRMKLCSQGNLSKNGFWKSAFIKFFVLLGKD